ncbi:MAG: hypothetical protein HFJ75_01755 [Eggerthellaceae bacterium]|nr:hypothetical protein [Eggerthellaceae bacterium]
MAVYLTHQSSLAFWRRWRAQGRRPPAGARARPSHADRASALEILDGARLVIPGDDHVHVSMPGPVRGRSDRITFHRWPSVPSRGSFVAPAPGVYVAAPELAFVEAASFLDLEHLILLGYELCGRYALHEDSPSGFCACDAATTTAQLNRYLGRVDGMRGTARARRAASYVLDNAESPRESAMAVLLTLPYRLGGCALRRPVLNQSLALSPHQRQRMGRAAFRCDALWPEASLALEYESDRFHSGEEAFVRDSKRRNDLRSLGIDVVTMTNDEIRSRQSTNRIADSLARKIGQRRGAVPAGYIARQERLRRMVLGAERPRA